MKMPTPISLSIVGAIITIFCGTATYFLYRQQVTTSKWPTVPGIITVSDKTLVFVENDKNERIGMAWQPVVNYTFKVDNIEYIGKEISRLVYQDKTIRSPIKTDSYADVPPTSNFLEYMSRYAVGKAVMVHYNPNNPKEALLEIDKTGVPLWGSLTLFGILMSVISLLYYFFRKQH